MTLREAASTNETYSNYDVSNIDSQELSRLCARREATAVADVEAGGVHRHELVDVEETTDHPHRTRHSITSRVGEASRLNEVDSSPASLDGALPGGLDVPDPVDIVAVGHHEHIVVTPPESVDRRPVHTS